MATGRRSEPNERPAGSPAEPGLTFVETGVEGFGRLTTPHYLRLPSIVLWVAGADLAGAFAIAPQPLSALEHVQRLYVQLYEPPNARALYTDLRAFEAEREMLAEILASTPGRTARAYPTRVAVVLGEGWIRAWWVGIVAMGVFTGGPTRPFTDPVDGWNWVGAPEPVRTAVNELTVRLSPDSDVRAQLAAMLRVDPTVTLESAARKLGVSARSLQRALRATGDGFAELRDRSRADIAAARLLRSDDKIDAVASDTGFRSRSHFVAWFRRLTGMTPAAFRSRHRSR